MAPNTTARPKCTARTAQPAPAQAGPPSTSTPCSVPRLLRPATARWCRLSRSSWCRRTATTNRIARAGRRGAGWPSTARPTPGSSRSILATDLYARQPLCEAVQATGSHFLFVCKPASHPTIQDYLTGVEMPEHVARVKRGRERLTHHYRWLCDVPLRSDEQALAVNWLSVEIVNAAGKVTYQNSFITDLPVDATTVAELAACGRARWKIENESFNVLKTKGYHLAHNFGHGKEHLSAVLATLNLIAFAIHTLCDLAAGSWHQAVATIGARMHFFQRMRAITAYLIFPSWAHLLETLAFARAPPLPP